MFTRKDNKIILFLIVRPGEAKGLYLLFRNFLVEKVEFRGRMGYVTWTCTPFLRPRDMRPNSWRVTIFI